MTALARSGQALPAVAGRLERGVRRHRSHRPLLLTSWLGQDSAWRVRLASL
jgi:hypothetical protein